MINEYNSMDASVKLSSMIMDMKKTETSFKNSDGGFKNILDNIDKKAISSDTSYKSIKKDEQNDVRNQNKLPFNSFREVKEYQAQETAQTVKKTKKVDEGSNLIDEAKEKPKTAKKPSQQNENEVINCLAQALQVRPDELVKLMGEMGIEPEQIAEGLESGDISTQLASFLGLSIEQKQVLDQVLGVIAEQAGSVALETTVKTVQADLQSAVLTEQEALSGEVEENVLTDKAIKDITIEVERNATQTVDLDKLKSDLKANMEEMLFKFQSDPQSFVAKLTEQVKNFLAENKVVDVMPNEEKENSEQVSLNEGVLEAQESTQKDEMLKNEDLFPKEVKEKQNEDKTQPEAITKAAATQTVNEDSTNQNQGMRIDTVAAMNGQKNDPLSEVQKAQKQTPVTKNEILSQVVEKAKVILTGDKSEMVMDLKPDHLGKLSLKVVTENGIVMAKFIAENQQVKQILEANMQLLKDSLQKQGMTIQGLSVSVGQNSQRQYENSKESKNSYTNRSSAKVEKVGLHMVETAAMLEGHSKMNPYDLHESKINLTA